VLAFSCRSVHVSDSSADFAALPLALELLSNLASLGYLTMTPIQAESLPPMLAGRDVIARAMTGSGKTAAFGLGLLSRLALSSSRVQGLVLCPTRELADQVAGEIRRLARSLPNVKVLTLCGGAPLGPQLSSLEHGAHIVVGTPGRVEEHLRKGSLDLAGCIATGQHRQDQQHQDGHQPESGRNEPAAWRGMTTAAYVSKRRLPEGSFTTLARCRVG
jgi:ATP-independent RNA helicase DbpA